MIILLATMLAAQQPIVVEGVKQQPKSVKKPKEDCDYVVLSGSRMRQRVCRDANGMAERNPGMTDSLDNPGMAHAIPGPAQGGLGGTPQ